MSAIFPDFWHPPSPCRQFFNTICWQFWPIFDPSPLPIAYAVYGRPLRLHEAKICYYFPLLVWQRFFSSIRSSFQTKNPSQFQAKSKIVKLASWSWLSHYLHSRKHKFTSSSLVYGYHRIDYRLPQSRQHWHMSSIQQNCHPKGCSKPIFAEQSFSNDD